MGGGAAELFRSASGERGWHTVFDVDAGNLHFLNAGCAGLAACRCPWCRMWYERPLCWKLVMPGVVRRLVMLIVRYGQPNLMLTVVPCKARCAGRDPRWAWYRPNACRAGVVPCRCGRHIRPATRATEAGAPNMVLQLTASRARSFIF
jgi:hypothetical protein